MDPRMRLMHLQFAVLLTAGISLGPAWQAAPSHSHLPAGLDQSGAVLPSPDGCGTPGAQSAGYFMSVGSALVAFDDVTVAAGCAQSAARHAPAEGPDGGPAARKGFTRRSAGAPKDPRKEFDR